jgi:outer membrane receptor protein involved in Fe transport
VKSYKVSNIGLDYDFKFLQSFKLGIQLANIFNYKYQSVEGRYMPGQNFNIYINFKF